MQDTLHRIDHQYREDQLQHDLHQRRLRKIAQQSHPARPCKGITFNLKYVIRRLWRWATAHIKLTSPITEQVLSRTGHEAT